MPRRPRPPHDRAHGAQHGGEVGDLGLPGRVLDDRGPLGQHGGHEEVVGGGVTRVLEHHGGAHEAATLDMATHLSVGGLEMRAHRGQAVDVEVDGPFAEVVAPGERHMHLATAGQERPEDTTEARMRSMRS